MRLLLIDVNCKSGSTGKIAYDLYTAVRADGDEAAICYGRGPLVKGENIYRFSPQWEVYVHALMTRITGLTGCFSPIATHNLLKFIKQYKPDVVHIHELHAYFVNLKPLLTYLKENHIKTIWTFHCEFMYTGKCGVSLDCDRWKTGCGHCPYLREYVATQWLDFTHHMWKQKKNMFENWKELTIITPSQWLADRVKQSFLSEIPVQVIHNSVNTDVFHPRPFEHLKKRHNLTDEKVVLAVAPDIMYERKGGPMVLKIAEQMQNEKIKFILIGFTPEQVETMTFPRNVIPIARTSNQVELAEYYSMADLFVICSMMENFPTTCLEAAACGTPICGFDVGGVKETYPGHDENFAPYGDAETLKSQIIQILQENKGKRDVYLRDAMLKKYLEIYSE